jgi:hypothetical protein
LPACRLAESVLLLLLLLLLLRRRNARNAFTE